MTKCDFCVKSGPDGKCSCSNWIGIRESYCEKAIEQMVKALGQETSEKRGVVGRRIR